MEACGSANHRGCWFAARGHTVRLIAPQFVAAFRKGGKNDAADAEAVAIAARQPTMRFVPIKTIDQQTILAWHCAREGWKEERTALMNRVRGLLTEFGIVIARSSERLLAALPRLTEDPRLADAMQGLLLEACEQLDALHARLARCEAQIANHARSNTAAQRVSALLGIGPITSSALAAPVPDSTTFRSGRQFGAWLGLTPKQHSSGGNTLCTWAHQLARQCLSANAFDPGGQKHPAVSLESGYRASQPAATMDHRTLRSPRLSQDPGRDRQQARAHRVGDPCQGRALRRFCLAATSHGAGVVCWELVIQTTVRC